MICFNQDEVERAIEILIEARQNTIERMEVQVKKRHIESYSQDIKEIDWLIARIQGVNSEV